MMQPSLTIATSVLLSAFTALSLSPALSALLLRPKSPKPGFGVKFFRWFNVSFGWTTNRYLTGVRVLLRHSAFALIALLGFFIGAGVLFRTLPHGFLPDEDQGVIIVTARLPDGASLEPECANHK